MSNLPYLNARYVEAVRTLAAVNDEEPLVDLPANVDHLEIVAVQIELDAASFLMPSDLGADAWWAIMHSRCYVTLSSDDDDDPTLITQFAVNAVSPVINWENPGLRTLSGAGLIWNISGLEGMRLRIRLCYVPGDA